MASTHRGCRALSESYEGVISSVLEDGMTRGPLVRFGSLKGAIELARWLDDPEHYQYDTWR